MIKTPRVQRLCFMAKKINELLTTLPHREKFNVRDNDYKEKNSGTTSSPVVILYPNLHRIYLAV
jgi:hypothetical protein